MACAEDPAQLPFSISEAATAAVASLSLAPAQSVTVATTQLIDALYYANLMMNLVVASYKKSYSDLFGSANESKAKKQFPA